MTHRPRWPRWPRWLPSPKVLVAIAVVLAFAALMVRIRGDLATAIHRVRPSGLVWLPLAFGAEGTSFLAYAAVQRRLLAAGGAEIGRRTITGLTAAATGISNLVPGGTAPSSGWLVSQYHRRGIPISLGLWAVLAGGFTAAISVLFLCLVGALIAGLIAPVLFVVLLALLAAAAVGGVAVLRNLPRLRSWLTGHRVVPGSNLLVRALGHIGDVGQFRTGVAGGAYVYLASVANWAFDVAVLGTGFAVLALPVPWRALLFAYAASQLAGALAPVPGGIGFVEGSMFGALTLAGTPTGDAAIATIVYRLVTTFGMAGIGSLALVAVQRREPRPVPLHGAAAAIARSNDAGTPAPDEPGEGS